MVKLFQRVELLIGEFGLMTVYRQGALSLPFLITIAAYERKEKSIPVFSSPIKVNPVT